MGKIYAFLAAAGALILAIFTAFMAGGRSKQNEIQAKTQKAAREYEKKATDELITGLENEQKVKNEDVDTTRRDHFS